MHVPSAVSYPVLDPSGKLALIRVELRENQFYDFMAGIDQPVLLLSLHASVADGKTTIYATLSKVTGQ